MKLETTLTSAELTALTDEARKDGYDDGHTEGYDAGYDDGYDAGRSDAEANA